MSTFTICETYNLIPDYVNNKIIGTEVLEVSNKKDEGDVGVLVISLHSPRITSCQYGWVIQDICI